ncbi:MAG: DUF1684 domain-containing protein [Flavobacteriales bacterium]|nr:DUF1684 domain-containing protein [Flavobacteriales bacterium]MBP6698320.1 DUF1684 domain-containing protein [Flavobacteriales bacterium]
MRAWLLAGCLVVPFAGWAQPDAAWPDSLAAYWSRMEAEFADSAHSPLLAEDRAIFEHLARFAPDPAFVVTARFKPSAKGRTFGMRTSTDRLPIYQDMGTLHFTLAGRKRTLHAYQNLDLLTKPGYEHYLFVPFTDLTNGTETYGGGRYLDLTGPLGPTVVLDFNRAYNPYCAYNHRYSCPIPPQENHLDLPVRAGVLRFHDP